MKHEKIIKKDAHEFKIIVWLYGEVGLSYNFQVLYRCIGKRKWFALPENLNLPEGYRKLNFEEKGKIRHLHILNYITKDEIYEAKIELWNKLKPKK